MISKLGMSRAGNKLSRHKAEHSLGQIQPRADTAMVAYTKQ